MLREHNLQIISLCRGGFFPHPDKTGRQQAIDDNKKAVDEAAELGAPMIVLVCGAVPGQALEESRKQIKEGILEVLPYAEKAGVKLAIEPLHPMYADSRSAINTLGQANDMAEEINSPWVGVAVMSITSGGTRNWKPKLPAAAATATCFAFHICDWKTPTTDLLNDRGLMGEGCINIRQIRSWVENAGFNGFYEVEIFSNKYWQGTRQLSEKD
jgi:sugar phosphate isomerase/epimerase